MWWNNYIGIPYKQWGYDRSGLNCYTLTRLIQGEVFNKRLPRHDENLYDVEAKKALGHPIPLEDVVSGDVLHMFSIEGGKRVDTHIATVTEPGKCIHVVKGTDSCIINYRKQPWKNLVIGAYRVD